MQQDEKMTLAVVTTFPPGRGTLNEYGYHLVRALSSKVELRELILLVDELPDGASYPPIAAQVPVRIQPCWRFGDWRNPLRILQAVRRVQPDAVFFNLQFTSFGGNRVSAALGLATPALVKAAGYPTAVLLHNIMETVDLAQAGFAANKLLAAVTRFFGNVMTRTLLKSDFVALTIPKYVEILTAKYGAQNVLLAPHGAFEKLPQPPIAATQEGTSILTFGKFGTYKVVEPLIDAVQVLRQNGHPDVELVIAGSDSPNTPGYLANVQQQVGAQPWLTFTGYVPEMAVPNMFRQATLVAFPYTSTTGSSGVLHQAGSYGKAAVLPRIGDLAELIADEGYTGEFFVPDKPGSLVKALARLLDDSHRRHVIERQNYVASCSLMIEDVADWYLLHLERIIKGKE